MTPNVDFKVTNSLMSNNIVSHDIIRQKIVSETNNGTKGARFAVDQTALGKQKNTFCGTPVSVPLPKFCEKNCFLTENFIEIGQLFAELRPKTILLNGGRTPS